MTQLSASVLSKPSDTPSLHATTRAGAEAGAVAVIIATAAKKTAPEPVDIWHVTSVSLAVSGQSPLPASLGEV